MKILYKNKIYVTKVNKLGHVVSEDGKIIFALTKESPLLIGVVEVDTNE